jgi:iron(III) transport system substrate-binding protein
MGRLLKRESTFKSLGVILMVVLLQVGCSSALGTAREVVIYTSVDQPYSEPILTAFEQATGIQVQAIYDVEAAKTTGLVNRLIAEKDHPQADVFWNSEIIQTIRLQEKDILQPYVSPQAEGIPAVFRELDGFWTGNAARARVIILNTELADQPEDIDSIQDFLDPKWAADSLGIAYPLFGTTATHAAALYGVWGPVGAREYFEKLESRGVRIVDGNSVVRDLVASGDLAFGLTDTDDACGALARGMPVSIKLPDQESLGTLVIPSTVALIAGAPNPEQGQALIDYLLSQETERDLMQAGYSHIPLHEGLEISDTCLPVTDIRVMEVDFADVYRYFDVVQSELRDVFIR